MASGTAMYLGTTPTLTGAIARNAELVAGFLPRQAPVTVITDPATAKALQFYRRYRAADAFLGFDAAARVGAQGPGQGAARPAFVVVNGPVVNEEEISGHRYGGGLTLSDRDREAALQLAPPGAAPEYAGRFPTGRLVEPLLRYRAVQSLLGSYTYRLTRMLTMENPPLAQVRVFRYGDGRPEEGAAPRRQAGSSPIASPDDDQR